MENYTQIVEWFKESVWQPHLVFHKTGEYEALYINANDLTLLMCSPHDEESLNANVWYANGKIVFDNANLFDKWSNALVPVYYPKTFDDFKKLLADLQYVSSSKFIHDYEYDVDHDWNLPEEMWYPL